MAQFEVVKRGEAGRPCCSPQPKTTLCLSRAVCTVSGVLDSSRGRAIPVAIDALIELSSRDADAEIRANAARALGDASGDGVQARLLEMIADESPRRCARSHHCFEPCRENWRCRSAIAAIQQRRNPTRARTSCCVTACGTALKRLGTIESAVALASDASAELRLLAVLQLRHQESAELARFLTDRDAMIRGEAIRAIYDTAAVDGAAGEALADYANIAELPPTVQRRVVAANYRRGTAKNAVRLMQLATQEKLDLSVREAALHALRLWEKRITTDPVLGGHRPIPGDARSQ